MLEGTTEGIGKRYKWNMVQQGEELLNKAIALPAKESAPHDPIAVTKVPEWARKMSSGV
jgi:hypothetical protein